MLTIKRFNNKIKNNNGIIFLIETIDYDKKRRMPFYTHFRRMDPGRSSLPGPGNRKYASIMGEDVHQDLEKCRIREEDIAEMFTRKIVDVKNFLKRN